MKHLNWIDSLTNEHTNVETPTSWIWWALASCVSAAAGNNYYVRTLSGKLTYYPNLYIMLLGPSGLGKGYPTNLAKMLVQEANVTRVIAGRSSIQAIIKELATTRTLEGKPPLSDSRGFIINGELSTAIIQDPDALTILTDLYDGNYNKVWTNLLKGDGPEKLKNPYITALFGSSPAHFYDSIPQANIEGGYIGRNLIIYEEKRARDLDLLDEGNIDVDEFETNIAPKYVPHLVNIAAKKGQLKPNEDARNAFNTWRHKWRATQGPDKTGFFNRVPDHVMKVSMCLALAEFDFNGEITQVHIEEAIQKVISLVYANKRTVEGRGPDPLAVSTKVVLDHLLAADNQELPRKTLLWKGYGTYNSFALDQSIENLLEMGWITRIKVGVGNHMDWLIRLAGEPLESYKKFMKDKIK